MDLSHAFFSGIAGTGMSALAQFLAFQGCRVSGSDRSLDRGAEVGKREYFQSLGIRLCPQDGTGVDGCSCLVVSTAIEKLNPEVQRAQLLGIPVIHRSDLLAELARLRNTIAVSGTSGKSTVTGMTYHILEAGRLKPSLITGANLVSLQGEGLLGNAKVGKPPRANGQPSDEAPDWLVMEADESDGSLIKYSPEIGLILNVEKDHKEISELMPLFKQFRDQTVGSVILNGSDRHCVSLKRKDDLIFFPDAISDGRVENTTFGDWGTTFTLAGIHFHIHVPGRHNLANAMAALAVGRALGISLADCARGLENYRGVERRHIKIGEVNGITLVDDFAHNPAKVKACLETVKAAADGSRRRVLAIFHPHGFAPMKLLGQELVQGIKEALDEQDIVFMPEIYYAGGTADKTISSADLIDLINDGLKDSAGSPKSMGRFFQTKNEVIAAVVAEARPGDWIVSMGARDPSLGEFAQQLFDTLGRTTSIRPL
jgi:UDP-N-acetylmuramate--alanine ligase